MLYYSRGPTLCALLARFFPLPVPLTCTQLLMTMVASSRDVYLVIGGSGFLGRHIVEALLARNDSVAVFDIVQRHHDVPFYSGDISEEGQVSEALRKVCPQLCVLHAC